MTLIEVKNLNKIYGSGEAEVKALKNINMNINQNTNLGLQLASQDYIEIGGKD